MLVLHLPLSGNQLKDTATLNAAVVVGLVLVDIKLLLTSALDVWWTDGKLPVNHKIKSVLTGHPYITKMNAAGLTEDAIFMECDWLSHTSLKAYKNIITHRVRVG